VLDQENPSERAAGIKSRRLLRVIVAGTLCLHLLVFVGLRQRIERGYPDFAVYYTAASMLREGLGHQLYAERAQSEVQLQFTGELQSRRGPLPYIHPAFEALIFVPLTWLPFSRAFLLWDLLNVAMLLGVALLLRADTALRLIPPWEFVLTSLAFFPVFVCLLQGQDSILQLLFLVLVWRSLKKQADVMAGCCLALGSFKFQFVLPIVLLLFFWKRKRILLGFVPVAAVLAVTSLGLVGWQGLLDYPAFVLRIVGSPGLGGVLPDFLPNLRGLVMGWQHHPSATIGAGIIILGSGGLFAFAATTGKPKSGADNINLLLALAIVVSGLIGWHTNSHDLTLLILPLVLVADYCLHAPPQKSEQRFALLYPAIAVLISPLWFMLWFVIGHMNLMAIPLLWWVWKIAAELSKSGESQSASNFSH
jgi:hypothetical protein